MPKKKSEISLMKKASMHLERARKAGDKERMHTELAHKTLSGNKIKKLNNK